MRTFSLSPCLRRGLAVLALAALTGTGAAAQGAPQPRPVVVELFTSQGCSSCPPADRLLGELAAREDVLALSYNITYWDYLGWRDTLGREEHTARQEAYATRFRDRKYTPQMVIDGESHMPGSRAAAVTRAVDARAAELPAAGGFAALYTGTGYHLEAAARPEGGAATIWLVHYDTRHEVEIARGENAGETIAYANVVRDITPLATWDLSVPLSLEIDAGVLRSGGHDGCAVIVQRDLVGPVIAAAHLDIAALN